MKKIIMAVLVMFGFGMVNHMIQAGQGQVPQRGNGNMIKAGRGQARLANVRGPLIIDTLPENVTCRVDGTLHIPTPNIVEWVRENKVPKDTKIIVYSHSIGCPFSPNAYLQLQKAGYTNVFLWNGGVHEAILRGFKMTGNCGEVVFRSPLEKDKLEKETGIDVSEFKRVFAGDVEKILAIKVHGKGAHGNGRAAAGA